MKHYKYFTQALLLFTIPSTAAYPQAEVPAVTFHSQPAEPNIVSKLTLNGHDYTYDDVLTLLDQIESGALEKICSDEDLDRINEFLASLAQEGMISDDPNENYELACDIQDLLPPGDSYEYAFAYGNDYIIAPMLYSNQGEYLLCKSWFHKRWDHTKKFIKKHKKTIIIVAATAIAVAVIVYTGGLAAAAGTGLAGTGGAIKAEQDLDDESENKPSSSLPSSSKPTDVSVLPSMRENPGIRSAFEDHLSTLQSFTSQNQGFMGPNDARLPFDSTYEENTRILGSVFGHRQLEDPSQNFADSNAKALAHQQIDQKFATDFAKHYTGSSQPSFAMSPETAFNADLYQFRGQRALDVAHYDQAISDLGKTLELNPRNPDAYLGRAKAHLANGEYDQSLEDYKEYSILKAACAPLKEDFLFRKGLVTGAVDSLQQVVVLANNFVTHPLETSAEVLNALGTLGKLALTQEWHTLGEALVPEVYKLANEWNTLSPEEKAERSGIVFGKCGSDIYAPVGLGKAISGATKGTQELLAVSRALQQAEHTLALETVARSGASGQELAEMAAKLARGERPAIAGKELTALGNVEGILSENVSIYEKNMKHIFRNAEGHLPDTLENRNLLLKTASNQNNYLGKDKFGNIWHAEIQKDGAQVWTLSRDGQIRNGGINQEPRIFDQIKGP